MASKPRKAFDGIGRPQGFVDDTAKAVLKAVKGAVKRSPNIRGTQFPKNQSLSPRKFDKIYGKGSAKQVAEQTKKNASRSEPPKPKQLPSIKGKDPRPVPSKPNPRAQTTAEMDESLKKAAREWAAAKPQEKLERKMSPYYKTSKNSRNY